MHSHTNLSEKGGLDILKEVNKQGQMFPIAITTNGGERLFIDVCRQFGAFACLEKPFGMFELRNVLAVLEVHQQIHSHYY